MSEPTCPFCKSAKVIPVNNVTGKHWLYCTDCAAAGPQKDSPEDAASAFIPAPPERTGLMARLTGKKETHND